MNKKETLVGKIRVVQNAVQVVKKVVVEIAAAVMFTIFAVPSAVAAAPAEPIVEDTQIEIVDTPSVQESDVIARQAETGSRILEATDEALAELRSRIGDTSLLESQAYRLAEVLAGIDFYGIQLDAATGSSTLNYMFFLPDLTQISINSLPETLDQGVVAVNIFKHRKRLAGDFMTLPQLRAMLLS